MNVNKALITMISFALCAACSSSNASKETKSAFSADPSEINSLIGEVDSGMRITSESIANQNDQTGQVPVEINKRVEKWLTYFSERDRERFQNYMDRGSVYKELIESKLNEIGVPKELYYLAMIESGFAVHAASHASAVGIWQFIKPTGQRYGLVVNPFVDERRDPIRSTVAAATYLRDLYNVFQSWFLAMAAYNAGESRIMNAIMKANSRNFWELASKKALPKETMDYVPKFIAASVIGHHPDKFGFSTNRPQSYPTMLSLQTPDNAPLSTVAEILSVPESELAQVNPHIRTGVIACGSATYTLWVPSRFSEQVERSRVAVLAIKPRTIQIAETSSADRRLGRRSKVPSSHVVRRGEDLAKIARRYQLSEAFIKERNHLSSNRLLAGKRLMLNDVKIEKRPEVSTYKVRRGDTLTLIAKRYGVNISALKKFNNLRRNHVYAGETIRLGPKTF